MKKLLILLLSISTLSACRYKSGSGNIVTEKRNAAVFTAVSVGGGFEVEIRQAAVSEIIVEADDNIIKYINTDVVNGKLKISLDDINVHDAHLKIFITAPDINSLNASAAAEIVVKDQLKSTGSIDLQASSGAKITTVLDAPQIVANASSGGDLKLTGRTRDLKATVSSGSTINAKELQSENANVDASSGGNVQVHASVQLDANASSGGTVKYKGGANVKQSVSSGGEVNAY